MNSPDVLELKISPWQTVVVIAMCVGTIVFLVWHFVTVVSNQGQNALLGSVPLMLVFYGFFCFTVAFAMWRTWWEAGVYLRVDERGVVVQTRAGRREIGWDEIDGFFQERRSRDGKIGVWITLRGQDNAILAQWDSSLFHSKSKSDRRNDEIIVYIRQKLNERDNPSQ